MEREDRDNQAGDEIVTKTLTEEYEDGVLRAALEREQAKVHFTAGQLKTLRGAAD